MELITRFPKVYLNRLKLVKASIVIAFALGVSFSFHLWIGEERLFPLVKPIDAIPSLASPVQLILMLTFISLCAAWIFIENRLVGLIAIGTLVIVLSQDQMRWQPWVYLYLLMLLPYLLPSHKGGNEKSTMLCLQLIIAGVYVWSGIQKLNSNFINSTFVQMIRVFNIDKGVESWVNVGYAVPVIEISIGFALLTSRFRKIGMYCAIAMHIAILVYLSPIVLNHNSVVYPWNVAMIFFIRLLFWGTSENLFSSIRHTRPNIWAIVPLVLVWIFPIFSFFGYWDHYLSFSLYSDKPSNYYIAVEQTELHKINKRFENYFAKIPGLQGGQIIDVNKWAYFELNVPFYPENRVLRKLSREFCELNIDEDRLVFLELFYLNRKPHYNTFTCKK